MKKDVDRKALQEVLGELEAMLEAYLAEWRQRLGIQERPEVGIDRREEAPVAPEREEQQR